MTASRNILVMVTTLALGAAACGRRESGGGTGSMAMASLGTCTDSVSGTPVPCYSTRSLKVAFHDTSGAPVALKSAAVTCTDSLGRPVSCSLSVQAKADSVSGSPQ